MGSGKGKGKTKVGGGKSVEARAKLAVKSKGKSAEAHARIQHTLVLLDGESGAIIDTKTLNHTEFKAQKKSLQAEGYQVLVEPEDVEEEDGQEVPAPEPTV